MAKAVAMLVVAAVVVAAMTAGEASADNCDPGQLAECLGAITGGTAPTTACCTNLSVQQGCLCQYARDPKYGQYISSPNARRVLTTCNIAIPNC